MHVERQASVLLLLLWFFSSDSELTVWSLVLTDDEGEDEEDDGLTLASDDSDDNMEEEETKPKPPAVVSSSVESINSQSSVGYGGSFAPCPPLPIYIPVSKVPWNLIHIKFQFVDGQMKSHQGIVLLLPGGVGHKSEAKDIQLSLEGVNTMQLPFLKVAVQWPGWIVEQEFFPIMKTTMLNEFNMQIPRGLSVQKKVVLEESFCEYMFGFQMVLMQTMELMCPESNNPDMESVTMIKLDMLVKKLTLDDWHIVGNKQGLRMLIVDLKAAEEKDYEEQKTKSVVVDLEAAGSTKE